jgi:hypothetical protein
MQCSNNHAGNTGIPAASLHNSFSHHLYSVIYYLFLHNNHAWVRVFLFMYSLRLLCRVAILQRSIGGADSSNGHE